MNRKYYYSFHQTKDAYAIYLSPQVIRGLLQVLLLILAIIFLLFYRQYLYNFLIYKNNKFTEDRELLYFVKQYCPHFKNAYSISYRRNNIFLDREENQTELLEEKYKESVGKEIVIEKALWLFNRYQQDLMTKNFKAIAQYSLEPFKSRHQYLGDRNTNRQIDIRYNYKISEIVPLNFEIREELKRFIVQINGEIVAFKISDLGYVLKGQSPLYSFTQYWDIALDTNNKSYIVTICQIKDEIRSNII